MADEYTPTNDEARIGYAQANHDLLDERLAQFDRWLAQHDREVVEIVATHTPELIHEGPNGEDDGQHLYCVQCGVLPIDGLGLQYGPQHVIDHLIAYVRGEGS